MNQSLQETINKITYYVMNLRASSRLSDIQIANDLEGILNDGGIVDTWIDTRIKYLNELVAQSAENEEQWKTEKRALLSRLVQLERQLKVEDREAALTELVREAQELGFYGGKNERP
jgi:hypothetical protein